MGQSTDAILCFGVCVASETIDQFEEHEDEGADAAEQERNPLGYFVCMGTTFDVDGVKLKLEQHQSSEYPEYILTVSESIVTAWRGHPKTIASLDIKPEWADAVRAACKLHGIQCEGGDDEPKWWLASDWC